MARNLSEAVIRLAKMQEHDRAQLVKMDEQWNRLMHFAVQNLDNASAGIDDIAAMLGIIEPQTSMPMLPANPASGPQPTVTYTAHVDGFDGQQA
jgi:hypothetical protein